MLVKSLIEEDFTTSFATLCASLKVQPPTKSHQMRIRGKVSAKGTKLTLIRQRPFEICHSQGPSQRFEDSRATCRFILNITYTCKSIFKLLKNDISLDRNKEHRLHEHACASTFVIKFEAKFPNKSVRRMTIFAPSKIQGKCNRVMHSHSVTLYVSNMFHFEFSASRFTKITCQSRSKVTKMINLNPQRTTIRGEASILRKLKITPMHLLDMLGKGCPGKTL